MKIEFDPEKDAINLAKHGVSLVRAADLDILAFIEDDRNEYGEVRYRAWGLIEGRAHCLAFTDRNGTLRAISLRRAHKKEMDRYAPPDRD
ncbi:BrnT family toxin [Falsirhodobacter sp. 20TX0035]|uniref:BrnT family toxin n=1 Tax=Falsirhodobacter sp. 20TX0035 TaxID=3022019 RepID=UPI00232FFDFB|nr:BrnT family toxin [Falsirhodobacter sp. 20TX0035]MDB6454147.1 BrnT family toxin [Falsirhodobacter sp. 20TX0035]